MNQFCKEHKKEIFLFLLMLFLELAMIFVLSQKNGLEIFSRSDANEFRIIVGNIINHSVFSLETEAPFSPTNFRTPGYVSFLLIIYLIFGSFKPAIFFGAAIFALSAPLAYLIAKEIFSKKIALVSAILFAIEPWALFQSGFLVAEQIFMPLFLFSIYLFYRYLKTGTINYIFYSSLFLGLTTLIRPLTTFFILIFVIFVFIFEYKHSFSRALRMAFLPLFIFIAVLSPWLIRNKIVLNTWQISSISGANLYFGNYMMLEKYLGKMKPDEDANEVGRILLGNKNYEEAKRVESAKILTDVALTEIKANFGSYIVMHLSNLPSFLFKNSYGNIFFDLGVKDANIQSRIIGYIAAKDLKSVFNLIKNVSYGSKTLIILSFFWPTVILLAVVGFIVGIKNYYRGFRFWFLVFWILYFLVLVGNLWDISRYKLTIAAPLFIFATIGFYRILKYFRCNISF